jgi:hypothetical protein
MTDNGFTIIWSYLSEFKGNLEARFFSMLCSFNSNDLSYSLHWDERSQDQPQNQKGVNGEFLC